MRVLPLYGELDPASQDAALIPARPGSRKIVLATSIAETSLTIEGIRVVVDAGLRRYAEFDPATGMSRLVTGKVSQAAADQRRGRAGRLSEGDCYRLWSEGSHAALSPQTPPEMLHADLAPLGLELACWGAVDASSLAWIDPPPAAPLAQARDLLHQLEAIDALGRVTPQGRALAALGMHPRLGTMLSKARDLGAVNLACDLAAVLSERDILRSQPGTRDADLRLRAAVMRGEMRDLTPGISVDERALAQAKRSAGNWRRDFARNQRDVADAHEAASGMGFPRSNRPGARRKRPLPVGERPRCALRRTAGLVEVRVHRRGRIGRCRARSSHLFGGAHRRGTARAALRGADCGQRRDSLGRAGGRRAGEARTALGSPADRLLGYPLTRSRRCFACGADGTAAAGSRRLGLDPGFAPVARARDARGRLHGSTGSRAANISPGSICAARWSRF